MRDRFFKLDSRRAPGLVGLWGPGPAGGNTLFDMSGYRNHGALVNMTPATAWVADGERRGMVMNLAAQEDHFLLPTFLLGTANFALSIWFKKMAGGDSGATLCSEGDTDAGEWMFRAYDTGSQVQFYGDAGDMDAYVTPFALDVWHYATAVRRGVVLTVYLDGVAGTPDSSAGDDLITTKALQIGGADSAGSRWFVGRLDDFRIYNRALSAAEVQHVYQSTLREPYSDIQLQPRPVFKAAAAPGFVSQKALVIGGGIAL